MLVVCFLMESNVERDTMRNLNKIWYSVRHLLSVYTTGYSLGKTHTGKRHSDLKTVFAMGSHNEIYELIRSELVTEGRQLLWRSRGLRLLHVVIGILVHRRYNYSVNLDYNMIKQTLKLNNIKQLITMEIPQTYKYDLEQYVKSLPVGNEDLVHTNVIGPFLKCYKFL